MDELIANWATVVGVWVAIGTFIFEKQRERRDREYGTYDSLDDKYANYLEICAQQPELDLYVVPLSSPIELDDMQRIRQLALFELLVSLFERAYLLYADHPTRVRKLQWDGWDAFIRQWARRRLFASLWKQVGPEQFDARFVRYIAFIRSEG